MANKLLINPSLLRECYNDNLPYVDKRRRSRYPSVERSIGTSNPYVKRTTNKEKGRNNVLGKATPSLSSRNSTDAKKTGFSAASKLLVAVMLLTLSILIIPSLLGFRFEVIRSGSMSPALDAGGLAITRPINPYSIEIGDVITYHSPSDPDTIVVHRVAGIDNGSPLSFLTKGDANKSLDAYSVPADAVVGQLRLYLPWIGYLVGFAKSFLGYIILLAIPGMLIIYSELNKLWTLHDSGRKERSASLKRRRNPYVSGRIGI